MFGDVVVRERVVGEPWARAGTEDDGDSAEAHAGKFSRVNLLDRLEGRHERAERTLKFNVAKQTDHSMSCMCAIGSGTLAVPFLATQARADAEDLVGQLERLVSKASRDSRGQFTVEGTDHLQAATNEPYQTPKANVHPDLIGRLDVTRSDKLQRYAGIRGGILVDLKDPLAATDLLGDKRLVEVLQRVVDGLIGASVRVTEAAKTNLQPLPGFQGTARPRARAREYREQGSRSRVSGAQTEVQGWIRHHGREEARSDERIDAVERGLQERVQPAPGVTGPAERGADAEIDDVVGNDEQHGWSEAVHFRIKEA